MSERLDDALRKTEDLLSKVFHDIINNTNTRYESEDDSDIYTIKQEGESK